MEYIIHIFVSIVSLIVFLLQLLMVARAITSWLPFDEDSNLVRFLTICTEPIILPIRKLLEKSDFFAGFPIDLSFMVAYILLTIIYSLLPAIRF